MARAGSKAGRAASIHAGNGSQEQEAVLAHHRSVRKESLRRREEGDREGKNDNCYELVCEHVESWVYFICKAIQILGQLAAGKINVIPVTNSIPASFSY
jgi:hypothetical protein